MSETPLAPGELAVGSQIAGYQIEQQIGRGGMAVVYRAFDLRLGRSVALKILAPELANDVAFRERFNREMRSAAAVDHPHIVPSTTPARPTDFCSCAMSAVRTS